MQTLSPEQEKIVEDWTTNGGPMIVSASAGSGKTRVLTECVRRILTNTPKEHFRLLCLTFTNKAAEEMLQRISNLKGLKERTFINNIHSFGMDIIRSYRHELGFAEMPHIIEREADRKDVLKTVFLQNPMLEAIFKQIPEDNTEIVLGRYQEELLTKTLQWVSTQKKNLTFIDDDVFEYNGWTEKRLLLFKLYNQYLRNQNLIEFDDILILAWRLLNIPAIVSIYRRLYKHVLIDEGQDLNYAQYQIIKALCGDAISNVFIVGDENQAIHGYAGADRKYMFVDFPKDFGARKANIQNNYRSSKAVLKLANLLLQKKNGEEQNQYYDGNQEIHSFDNETDEANWVISKIEDLLDDESDEFEGKVTLDKIAVLARNKFVFNELRRRLDENGFLKDKYFLKRGTEVIESESSYMKVFDLGTRLLANRQGDVYWRQVLAILEFDTYIPMQGESLESLLSLQTYFEENSVMPPLAYEQLLTVLAKIEENLNYFPKALDDLQNSLPYLNNENERNNAQLDIEEWKEAWKSYSRNTQATTKSLADFRRYTAMGFNKNILKQGLTLANVHIAKGLEFDIVFLIGMNEGTFPDYRALRANGKALEEEKNNAYVAITRAKRHIYITYPMSKMMPWGDHRPQVISSFIKDFPIGSKILC